jgi:hypothetical protein
VQSVGSATEDRLVGAQTPIALLIALKMYYRMSAIQENPYLQGGDIRKAGASFSMRRAGRKGGSCRDVSPFFARP